MLYWDNNLNIADSPLVITPDFEHWYMRRWGQASVMTNSLSDPITTSMLFPDSIWFIWFDTFICLSNLSCYLWNRKLKIKEFLKKKHFFIKTFWSHNKDACCASFSNVHNFIQTLAGKIRYLYSSVHRLHYLLQLTPPTFTTTKTWELFFLNFFLLSSFRVPKDVTSSRQRGWT